MQMFIMHRGFVNMYILFCFSVWIWIFPYFKVVQNTSLTVLPVTCNGFQVHWIIIIGKNICFTLMLSKIELYELVYLMMMLVS